MSSICDGPFAACPLYDTTREVSDSGEYSLNHAKNRSFTLTVGETVIPLQLRVRNFTITHQEQWSWANPLIVVSADVTASDCGAYTDTGSATVSEHAVFTDSELIYVDHVNKIALWREWTETYDFTKSTTKRASFKVVWGTSYSWWLEVTPIKTQTEKWYVLVNGVKEEVDSWTFSPVQAVINILWPLPPSLAIPTSPPDSFYDYFEGGPGGPGDTLKFLDGGIDFYYPEWLRSMGLDKTMDKAEAEERYSSYYFHDPYPPTEEFLLPELGFAKPWGNAVKDADGNILVSFQARNKTINRLYLADEDKTVIDLNTTGILEGDNLKLYPVGII
jgi:hypothetical protein